MSKPSIPRLSESEWLVANIVWNLPGSTAAQISGQLPDGVAWKQKTVNTFLARLAVKGVIAIERDGKANLHSPLLRREDCVRAESASFLQRVLAGAAAPVLAHFCEAADLTTAEIAGLQAILDRKRKSAAAPAKRRSSS